MSLQISVMLILLAPCFWPEVEYIALLQQMESEFHWEMEIGWLPANGSALEAEWAVAKTSCLESVSTLRLERGKGRVYTEQKYAWVLSSADVYTTF